MFLDAAAELLDSECWSIPAGARNAGDMAVVLQISLTIEGNVKDVEIVDKERYVPRYLTFTALHTDIRIKLSTRLLKSSKTLKFICMDN